MHSDLPYVLDGTLWFQAQDGAQETVKSELKESFQPQPCRSYVRSPSCLGRQGIPPDEMMVLKVYDRRFATAVWHFHIDEPCSEDLEEPYLQHLINATLSEDEYKFLPKEIEQLIPG
jgi:hypothetical protein